MNETSNQILSSTEAGSRFRWQLAPNFLGQAYQPYPTKARFYISIVCIYIYISWLLHDPFIACFCGLCENKGPQIGCSSSFSLQRNADLVCEPPSFRHILFRHNPYQSRSMIQCSTPFFILFWALNHLNPHLGLLNPHFALWNPYLVYINIHQWQPWPSYSHLSPHRALYSSRPVGSQQPRWSQNSMVLHQKSEEIY